MTRPAGFTLIEMVMLMLIIGILAVVAMPRFDSGGYQALSFHDRVVGALRHAQKTATSHRRLVCVGFTASSVTLTIDVDASGSCDTALPLPGSSSSTLLSDDPVNVVFSPVPADFNFLSDGTGADRSLQIAGQPNIVVVGATGHVQ